MTTNSALGIGQATLLRLKDLRLDPKNPRIPESLRGQPTPKLAELLVMGFEAYSVAQSIVDYGYFQAEPLLVIPSDTEPSAYTVVEGNRRLTALLGLADASIRENFPDSASWDALARKRTITMEMDVPVVIHASREDSYAEVARAHIVRKLGWRPYMQARWVAARISEGRTMQEAADLMGITKSKAADLYRDQAVLAQAAELGLDTSQVESAFSLLTVALGSTKIRDHIGAPLGSRLDTGTPPIADGKVDELREVVQWIFGDNSHEALISDSRQISGLGNVIANDNGLTALRQGKTLEEAKQAVAAAGLDPHERIVKILTTARSALQAAANEVAEFALDGEVNRLVEDIESLTDSIRSSMDEVSEDAGIET
jgi:hypothetical protein